jgi:hypothetical protein
MAEDPATPVAMNNFAVVQEPTSIHHPTIIISESHVRSPMERQPRIVVGGSVVATCSGSWVYVGVPFARLRRDVRWHRSMVPSSVCAPCCFDEVFLDSSEHGSSTCPPSSALAPPTSSHSWSRADGCSRGLASSPSTPGSTSSGTLYASVAGRLQPALEPPPPLFMSPSWTWTLQGSRRTYSIA